MMDRIYRDSELSEHHSTEKKKKTIIIIILLTSSIMKTLCLALLLLYVCCCCNAMPAAVEFSTAPTSCCFQFKTQPLPSDRVASIMKTHSSCLKKAFIVQTVKGRLVCYNQTFQWAMDVYDQQQNPEGSGY